MKFLRKIIFHRVLVISFSILMQLLILVGVILKFNNYFVFFYGLSVLLSVTSVIVIINSTSNPAYKIAWIIPILIFPIFGGMFYIFFGKNKLNNRMRMKMKPIENKMKDILVHNPHVINKMENESRNAANQSRYIQDYAYCPPYCNGEAKYLPTGESKFYTLMEELKKAQHYIFLEYFIIEEGTMWNGILDILIDKAKSGVDVRVIYDDIGSMLTLPHKYYRNLEDMGIKCCVFNPFIPVLSPKLNNRDHRKIVVIDGHTGFTGGINIADEYINRRKRFGHWKDSAIMIKGEAVKNMTVMFLSMWDYLTGGNEDFAKFSKVTQTGCEKNNGYVQPFTDSPLDNETVGEIIYLNLINKAENYVYITTPYLIIDNEMMMALSLASKCGVDVRIITPYLADKWFVHYVTRSYYKALIECGVKIYEYTPGFIHSKTYAVDDKLGVVGTINMDYRSLYLHFECGVWMYNCETVIDMRKDFIETIKICKEITIDDINKIKWYKTLLGSLLRVFSPLM